MSAGGREGSSFSARDGVPQVFRPGLRPQVSEAEGPTKPSLFLCEGVFSADIKGVVGDVGGITVCVGE